MAISLQIYLLILGIDHHCHLAITNPSQHPNNQLISMFLQLIPRLHYQPVSSRFSSCALTSPVSTSVCVYITTARTGLNQRQLVRLISFNGRWESCRNCAETDVN